MIRFKYHQHAAIIATDSPEWGPMRNGQIDHDLDAANPLCTFFLDVPPPGRLNSSLVTSLMGHAIRNVLDWMPSREEPPLDSH